MHIETSQETVKRAEELANFLRDEFGAKKVSKGLATTIAINEALEKRKSNNEGNLG